MSNNKITLEQVQEFMTMLTSGELPEGLVMPEQPALTPTAAFAVIWYLQEYLRVLPDHIEQCCICGELFDADCDGHIVADDDEDDPWTKAQGIDPALLKRYQGAEFCSESCEHAFWSDPAAYVRPAPMITFTEMNQ
ncbi:MAG TPA: hypothetical protein PKH77_00515 [Anaerolineae bacterium]|nr:hypothetical protein [Anaerolineae bacterium]